MTEWLRIHYASYDDVPAEWGSPETVKISYGFWMNEWTRGVSGFFSLYTFGIATAVTAAIIGAGNLASKLITRDLVYGNSMRISEAGSFITSVTIKRQCGEEKKVDVSSLDLQTINFSEDVSLRVLWGGSSCQSLRERLDQQQQEQERRRQELEAERRRQAEAERQRQEAERQRQAEAESQEAEEEAERQREAEEEAERQRQAEAAEISRQEEEAAALRNTQVQILQHTPRARRRTYQPEPASESSHEADYVLSEADEEYVRNLIG